ncbi:hypothetical protein K0U83_06340 [bacterium]|nr:hypothetical protein [bacterium]
MTELSDLMEGGDVLKEIETVIREAASEFLDVGQQDLNLFASRLAGQVVYAHQVNNQEIIDSAGRQARLLAELQRIRANDAAWDTFYTVVSKAAGVSLRIITTLLTKGATIAAP